MYPPPTPANHTSGQSVLEHDAVARLAGREAGHGFVNTAHRAESPCSLNVDDLNVV